MRLSGLGVSPGIGIGKALVIKRGTRDPRFRVSASRVEGEIARLSAARERSRGQLRQIRERIARSAGAEHAYLFDAQLLMLDDPMLIDRAAEIIRAERLNAGSSLDRALDEISALFDQAEDPYLRERKGDVGDVVGRLRMNLRAGADARDPLDDLEGPIVLVADELPPSMVAQFDPARLAGLVTDAGSWTYHSAILARSIHVPAVTGLRGASATIPPGAVVAVDGGTGEVFVEPDAATIDHVRGRQRRRAAYEESLEGYRRLPPVTADGVLLRLEANVESPGDAERARDGGADGIGLFRSEFLLAPDEAALGEEEQYRAYARLVEQMAPGRVTIRTFDLSPSRLGPGGTRGDAAKAPLGLRGVRLSLAMDDMFQAQLRALLRAAAHGPLRIMFPFVSGVEELREARAAVARAAAHLRERGQAPPAVPIGIMIEVPSAAITADLLAGHADFFSIGTNDLIQYVLAADRTDDRVSRLYEPLHPAILRLLRIVARAGRRRNIPVSVCGEMAADPRLLPLLVGLGLRELSMAPTAIPPAKQAIRELHAGAAARVAARALRAHSAAEVEALLVEHQNMELRDRT